MYFYTSALFILLILVFPVFSAENTQPACNAEDTLSALALSLLQSNHLARGVRKSVSEPLAYTRDLPSSSIDNNLLEVLQSGNTGVLEQHLKSGSFPLSLQSIKQHLSQKNMVKLLIQYGARVEQDSLDNYGFEVFDKFVILGKRAQVIFEIISVLLSAGEHERVKQVITYTKTYFTFDQPLREDFKILFGEILSDSYMSKSSDTEITEKDKKEFRLMQRVLKAARGALLEKQDHSSELALALKQLKKSPKDEQALEELEAAIMRTASYAVGQGHSQIVALFVYLFPVLKPSLLELVDSILVRIESEKADSIIPEEEAALLHNKYNEIKTLLSLS